MTGDRPPTDRVESEICAAFALALSLPLPVRVDDDFFALGGTSIQAVDAVARIATALDVDVAVGDLLLAPSPVELAASLRLVARADGTAGRGTRILRSTDGSPRVLMLFAHEADLALTRFWPDEVIARGVAVAPPWDGDLARFETVEPAAERQFRDCELLGIRPRVVAGYCRAGSVASAVAARLADGDDPPDRLVVVDPPYPAAWPHLGLVSLLGVPPGSPLVDLFRERLGSAVDGNDQVRLTVGNVGEIYRTVAVALPEHLDDLVGSPLTGLDEAARSALAAAQAASIRAVLASHLYEIPALPVPVSLIFSTAVPRSAAEAVARAWSARSPSCRVRHVDLDHEDVLASPELCAELAGVP